MEHGKDVLVRINDSDFYLWIPLLVLDWNGSTHARNVRFTSMVMRALSNFEGFVHLRESGT